MSETQNKTCAAGSDATCPHCGRDVQFKRPPGLKEGENYFKVRDDDRKVWLVVGQCPSCQDYVITLIRKGGEQEQAPSRVLRIHPQKGARPQAPPKIPVDVRDWYDEALRAESVSERGAAALARACLQALLRQQGFKGRTLYDEIDAAKKDDRVPGFLHPMLDLVRKVAAYSAHPTPDPNDIASHLTVGPGELDALFETLLQCFDAFYVKPARRRAIIEQVNAKLPESQRIELPPEEPASERAPDGSAE